MKNRLVRRLILILLCASMLCAYIPAPAAGTSAGFDINSLWGLEMISASGAGAWEGRLSIELGGRFKGEYYETDMDVTESVVFYGQLTDPVQISDTVWKLTVTDVSTDDTPGGRWTDETGQTYVYTESVFPEGSTVLLTLPGTPEEQIPEMVRMLLWSTMGMEDVDYSGVTTLTREDGWGFFTMPGDTFTPWEGDSAEEGVIHGPLSDYNWNGPGDTPEIGHLLWYLYAHVGLWYNKDRDDTLLIKNCSMTNLEYLVEFSRPDLGTIRFDYVGADPQGRFLILYSEDGEYEARVYLPSEASGVFVQYFAKDPAVQEKLGYGRVYEYNWREFLPDTLGPEYFPGAWANLWYDADNDATLEINDLGNGRIQIDTVFSNGATLQGTVEVTDYEILEWTTDDGKYYVNMQLNGWSGGRLEMMIWPVDESREPEGGMAENVARDFHFTAEVPPDLTRYGWTPDVGNGEDFAMDPVIVPLDGETPEPAAQEPAEEPSGEYLVEGPLSSWDGVVPDSDAIRDLFWSLYLHVGTWSEEGRADTVAILCNSMTGLDYTMIFDMPGLVNIEFDYVTADEQARFITFYTSDGEYEARVYLPSIGSGVWVQVFARDAEMQRMLGRGYAYHYSTWSPRPDCWGQDRWARIWEGEWTCDSYDATMTIEDAGDNVIHIIARLAPGVVIDQRTAVTDYHYLSFDTSDQKYRIEMYIDGLNGGQLEFQVSGLPDGWIDEEWATRFYLFIPEYPVDLTMVGWDFGGYREEFEPGLEPNIVPVDGETSEPAFRQPVSAPVQEPAPEQPASRIDQGTKLTDEEKRMLYLLLEGVKLQIGSGTRSGQLEFGANGSFKGHWLDTDAKEEVYFSGAFGDAYRITRTTFLLIVSEASTRDVSGTAGVTDDGTAVTYIDTLMPAGREFYLTLPGTVLADIPELVWDDIRTGRGTEPDPSDYYTLTGPDGRGFYGEPARNRHTVVRNNPFNRNLFLRKPSVYNNTLALIAAQLSWKIEDQEQDGIAKQFEKYSIVTPFYGEFNNRTGTYEKWDGKAEGAFAIGRKILSIQETEDTTVLVIVARGTMRMDEARKDFFRDAAEHPVMHVMADKDIIAYDNAIWDALNRYLNDFPIDTPKVKILVTGHSLGGAMANMAGAHITSHLSDLYQLRGMVTKDDVYVYTFGAIKVLQNVNNISSGYENIHNIYNYWDSYGPYGNWGFSGVSSPNHKYGHTEMYSNLHDSELFLFTFNNHLMDNYTEALRRGYVHCSLSSGNTASSGQNETRWYRHWDLNGDPNSSVDITRNPDGSAHIVFRYWKYWDYELDVVPGADWDIFPVYDEDGGLAGYLYIRPDGTMYLYLTDDCAFFRDNPDFRDYYRSREPVYSPGEPTDAANPAPTGTIIPADQLPTGSTVVADDDAAEVVFLDVVTVGVGDGTSRPGFRVGYTNRLDTDVVIRLGKPDGSGAFGSVGGVELNDLLIFLPDGTPVGDTITVPAGATVIFVLCPAGGGYGYRAPAELADAILFFYIIYGDGNVREYAPRFDTGIQPAQPGNARRRVDADAFGFSFEIPEDWEIERTGDIIRILPPPRLSVTWQEILTILSGWDGAEDDLASSDEYTRTDGTFCGRPAVIFRARLVIVVIIRLDDGSSCVLLFHWDEAFDEVLRQVIAEILGSIRFSAEPASEEPISEAPDGETEPEPGFRIPEKYREILENWEGPLNWITDPVPEDGLENGAIPTDGTVPDGGEAAPEDPEPAPEAPEVDPLDPETAIPETAAPAASVPDTPTEAPASAEVPAPDEATVQPPAVQLLPVEGKPGYGKLPVSGIRATSYIVNQKQPDTFIPFRMIDGDETTSWQFSTKESKLGSCWIYVDFPAEVNVDELWIKNGFWRFTDGHDQYIRNCRIKDMTVDFRYAGATEYSDPMKVRLPDLKERKDWQTVDLSGRTGVTGIRICIRSVYKGSKFKNDVAVSEIMFVQRTN